MARGTVPIQTLTLNGGTIAATPLTITAADGAVIQAGGRYRRLVVHIKQTGGTAGTASLVPGNDPPAFRQGLGTATVVVPATTGERLITIESARFAQANGDIYLDFSASVVGTVSAYNLPADA
jgi:hypothetical protein